MFLWFWIERLGLYFWALLMLIAPVALLLEVLLPVPFFGMQLRVPWMSAVVVYYALYHKLTPAFVVAVVMGCLLDGFSMSQPGPGVLVYGVLVYLADRFRRQIVAEAAITAAVFGIATCFSIAVLRLGLLVSDHYRGLSLLRGGGNLGFAILAGALVTPWVCLFLNRLHRGLDLLKGEGDQHVNA
jgi:rod shape-determining protein MreD